MDQRLHVLGIDIAKQVFHLQPIAVTREDVGPLLAVVAVALAFHVLPTVLGARTTELPVRALSVYFDGHLYIEIAKSFPLPYPPESFDYMGHAPGYPALIYLGRRLSVDDPGWIDFRTLLYKATDGLEAAPGAH
jgi:hypothetical protein